MSILEYVIVFLSIVVIIFAGLITYLAFTCETISAKNDMQQERIEQLKADNETLLSDNFELYKENDKLLSDNKQLISLSKTLMCKTKLLQSLQKQNEQEEPPPAQADMAAVEVSEKERLPAGNTNIYRCEDYRKLNLHGSEQLALQQVCHTEQETGLRYYRANGEIYYCVALAGAYGSTIGDTWRVTLKNDYEFNIIFADFKHPHQITNPNPNDFGDHDENYDKQPTTSVIEFVYDEKVAPKAMIKAGTMSYFIQFGGLHGDGGNIVKMEFLGRKWRP